MFCRVNPHFASCGESTGLGISWIFTREEKVQETPVSARFEAVPIWYIWVAGGLVRLGREAGSPLRSLERQALVRQENEQDWARVVHAIKELVLGRNLTHKDRRSLVVSKTWTGANCRWKPRGPGPRDSVRNQTPRRSPDGGQPWALIYLPADRPNRKS